MDSCLNKHAGIFEQIAHQTHMPNGGDDGQGIAPAAPEASRKEEVCGLSLSLLMFLSLFPPQPAARPNKIASAVFHTIALMDAFSPQGRAFCTRRISRGTLLTGAYFLASIMNCRLTAP
jgi:hypothetical protein